MSAPASTPPAPAEARRILETLALNNGFDLFGVAPAQPPPHAHALRQWLAEGRHATMHWMERSLERRTNPLLVLPGARSILCLAVNYWQGGPPVRTNPNGPTGRIARYAWGGDYHDWILARLRPLEALLRSWGAQAKSYTDTGPILERDFAALAGLGWQGKSTMLLNRTLGKWFFLAEILTTLELPPDSPAKDHCGKCTACITACPTKAITAPHQLDARRCLSYLTIEHKGPIPHEFRRPLGDRIYGCDACLDACPWNRFAHTARESFFHARQHLLETPLRNFLSLTDTTFRDLFRGSPIKRIKRPRFLRNVCIALGNTGTPDDLPALRNAASDPDPLIAEAAHWAIAEIHNRSTTPAETNHTPLPLPAPQLS